MSLTGLGSANVRADEGQQEFVNDRPILVSKREYQQNRDCPTVTKNLALDPDGASHQDRLANWPSFIT
jgi:hypothetical protein